MQKPLVLSIAACLGYAGCRVFEKSESCRAKHGTDCDRFSPADRRKVLQLQSGLASAE